MRLRLVGRNDEVILPLLSWICSTLPEFRLWSAAPAGLICSLSGFASLHPYANPPQGEREKRGFTLAEVLITLGIIGVVASLTIPQVIKNYEQKVISSQLKKFVSTFTTAYNYAVAEYGDSKNWERCTPAVNNSLCSYSLPQEYIFSKFSGINCSDNVIPETYKKEFIEQTNKKYGTHLSNSNWSKYQHCRLKDGTFLLYVSSAYTLDNEKYTVFVLDANGSKKPNKYGKDIFGFGFFYENDRPMIGMSLGGFIVYFKRTPTQMLLIDGFGYTDVYSSGPKSCSVNNVSYACQDLLQKNGWNFPKFYPW